MRHAIHDHPPSRRTCKNEPHHQRPAVRATPHTSQNHEVRTSNLKAPQGNRSSHNGATSPTRQEAAHRSTHSLVLSSNQLPDTLHSRPPNLTPRGSAPHSEPHLRIVTNQ